MGRGLGDEQKSILLYIGRYVDDAFDWVPWRNLHAGQSNPAASAASSSRALRQLERRGLVKRHDLFVCDDGRRAEITSDDSDFRQTEGVTLTEAGAREVYRLICKNYGADFRKFDSAGWWQSLHTERESQKG